MNLALERFADNPIIDELVTWPPRSRPVVSLRACNPLFRKPFIEVEIAGGEVFQRHFPRDGFNAYWAEASVILDTLTTIRLKSDLAYEAIDDADRLARRVLAERAECIEESYLMFEQGMYRQFLMQYGADCRDLPEDTLRKIATARREISEET